MKTYEDYSKRVRALVQDNSDVTDESDIEQALSLAAETYSENKLLKKVDARTGDGTRLFSLPSDWDAELSRDTFLVEFPVDNTAVQPTYLLQTMVDIYNDAGTEKLRFVATESSDPVPESGEAFRIHYKIPHTISPSSVTPPDSSFKPLGFLAASYLCYMIAERLAHSGDALNEGGSADYRSKTDKLRTIAKDYRKEYDDYISPVDNVSPACVFGEFKETAYKKRQRGLFPRDDNGRKQLM